STSGNFTRRFDVSDQNREKEKKKKKEGRFPKIRPLDNNLWKFDLSDNDLWKSSNSTSLARKFDLTCSVRFVKMGSPSLDFVRKTKQKNEKKMKPKYSFSIYSSVAPLERAWHNSNSDRVLLHHCDGAWLRRNQF
ncbi:dihydrolipoamide dehydrogenase E1 subunit alpha subunit, partial [Striga asiatica]